MFELNEAPQRVLNALKYHQGKRFAGTLFGALFCCPTLGWSAGLGSDPKADWKGCCPGAVTNDSYLALEQFKANLQKLMIDPARLGPNVHRATTIESQVRGTINLLNDITKDKLVNGSYLTLLNGILNDLRTQATLDTRFSKVVSDGASELYMSPYYVPQY